MSNSTSPSDVINGWVDQPNGRGTLDILWSCLLLLVVSTWTVLHLNNPAEHESQWEILARKCRWAAFILLGPEMLCIHAGLQWMVARDSIRILHVELKIENWTIVHGFFADSGGFVLHTPDMPPFPVNTRAIHYLVQKNYIKAPSTTRQEIEDRSKADTFLKAFTAVQGFYLVSQCIARRYQGMEISCLELATTAFVFCTAISYFFFLYKPLDVQTSIPLCTSTSMRQILIEAGPAASSVFDDTPMDFVEQPGWRAWRRRAPFKKWGGLTARPLDRIPNDYNVKPEKDQATVPYFLWLTMSVYGGIHLLAWNFYFPTLVEQYLWRAASVTSFAVLFVWGFVEVLAIYPWFDFDMTVLGIWVLQSTDRPLWRRWILDGPGTISSILYFFARTAMIAESFASLRSQKASVYETVNWTRFIPHV